MPHRSSKEICRFGKSLVNSWPQGRHSTQWGIRLQNCATLRYIENNQDVALSNFLDGTYLKIEAGWDNVEELSSSKNCVHAAGKTYNIITRCRTRGVCCRDSLG